MQNPMTHPRTRAHKMKKTQRPLPLLLTLNRLFPLISKYGLNSTILSLKMGLTNIKLVDRLIYLAQIHFPDLLTKCTKKFRRRKLMKEQRRKGPVKVQKEIKSLEFYLSL